MLFVDNGRHNLAVIIKYQGLTTVSRCLNILTIKLNSVLEKLGLVGVEGHLGVA